MSLSKYINLAVCLLLLLAADAAMGQKISLLTLNSSGTGGSNGNSFAGGLSADDRYLVFQSSATDLVPNVMTTVDNIYVRDLQTGSNTLVSANSAGTDGGNSGSYYYSITPDGRFVLFVSDASDLVPGDTNDQEDLFVRDLLTGTTVSPTVLIPQPTNLDSHTFINVTISNSGRFLIYSRALNDGPNRTKDIVLHDLMAGTTTLVSANRAGTGGAIETPSTTPSAATRGASSSPAAQAIWLRTTATTNSTSLFLASTGQSLAVPRHRLFKLAGRAHQQSGN